MAFSSNCFTHVDLPLIVGPARTAVKGCLNINLSASNPGFGTLSDCPGKQSSRKYFTHGEEYVSGIPTGGGGG